MGKTKIVIIDGCDFFDLYSKIKKNVVIKDIISLSHYYPTSSGINCSAIIVLNDKPDNTDYVNEKNIISINSFYPEELIEKIKLQKQISCLSCSFLDGKSIWTALIVVKKNI